MSRVVCFDIETTGLDFIHGDRCIEIGAVELVDGKLTKNTFHEYINPEGKVIPAESYMVHKISNAFLDDKPIMAVVAPKFLEFIGDSKIVAHNGLDFDFPFINYELERIHMNPIPRNQM
ncbi:MAG: ribonuclease H-like domain-containing protein, partial [Alphaproteobacteria bacterium]|nr:ribonuclease H-like domain-containing protein [Alphaproteobacteria bacterium]